MRIAVRLYRRFQPVLGKPIRAAVHAARLAFTGDTSQLGEALVARAQMKPDWPEWVVEVGANDGITNSNSRLFVKAGWNALLIEPNPPIFAKLEKAIAPFPKAKAVQMACTPEPGIVTLKVFDNDPTGQLSKIGGGDDVRSVHEHDLERTIDVQADTLTSILEKNGVPEDFSLLSIDTEGLDLHILSTLDLTRFRPRIVIIETDDDVAVEGSKRKILEAAGYEIFEEVGVNSLWRIAEAM